MKITAGVITIISLLLVACDSGPAEEILAGNDSLAIQLIVTDTIGVELGDSCYVFGYAADAARTDSIIYVLDMSRAQLRKYTPDGEYAGYMGGNGDGPGELSYPQWMELLPDGSVIIQDVTDLGLYDPQGNWLNHILTHSGNWPSQHTITGTDAFAIRWHEFISEPSFTLRQFISSYNLNGDFITEFMTDSISVPVESENNNDALNRMLFSHYFAGDMNGNLYLVQRHTPEYRILCYTSEGIAFDTLSLDLPVVEKTEYEISLEKQYIEEYLTGMGTSNVMQWIYEPDSFREPIAGIWLGWEGNLWVLRGTTVNPVFDVWGIPEGEYLYQAELSVEIPPTEFLTFYINPYCKGFLAVHEDEAMVQRILLIEVE
ncbi:MAG: hypothetical protein U9P42_01775 [Candidatus Fermentibacteria bacterium]|nr:hypothetical protein [Candidatus Fermentibacteria bacterium]